MKKAVFFTIDSLLASGIVILAILLVSNFYSVEKQRAGVNYASQDLVRVFSTMTVGEVNNDYAKFLIANGYITNTNSTILEQIGDFWASGNTDLARNLTKNLTESIFPAEFGYSVLVNGEEIYSRSLPIKLALVSSQQMISGIAKAKPTHGFTARVLLNGIKSKKTNAYAYFGGYEGDGNLTKKLSLPTNIISFNSSYLEVNAGGSFNLYINSIYSGSYVVSGNNIIADKWNISNAYLSNFRNGENTISMNFTSGNNYIAGGFLRVTYATSSFNDTQAYASDKYIFPGIEGVINLYSSIYVPGPLSNMKIFINYSSSYNTFLKLGNTTIYQENPNGTKNITLSNSTLSSLLDYSTLNQKTIPLRFGLTHNGTIFGGNADAVLVSDVSGSMDWCSKISSETWSGWTDDPNKGCRSSANKWYWGTYSFTPNNGYSNYNRTMWYNGTANLCGCRYNTICQNDSRKLDVYINASKQFTDILLNSPNNNMGLVEFSSDNQYTVYDNTCSKTSATTTVYPNSTVRVINLTFSKQHILNNISTTQSWWETCTCCGVNKAVDILNTSQNNPSRKKYIIVMSDGIANTKCPQQPNGTAIADAVQSAWDACNKNISVYTIAFGNDADAATMQRMNCSGGKFFNATDTTKLQQVFKDIANEINTLSFTEQIANFTGTFTKSALYPNSYIEFNYTPQDIQFNKLPIGFETDSFGNNISTGSLVVFPNTSVIDAKVTSYSGSKWTDNLVVNGAAVYRLGDYNSIYQDLGDPFIVAVPAGNIIQGNNSFTISTGINSSFSTNGSSDDRVIYTLLLNGVGDYTSVLPKSNGCSWTVDFEDGTSSTIKIPPAYSGADSCSFSSQTYDANDAINDAVYQLFSNLDFDKNGKLNVVVDQSNLNVYTLTISKVPSLWGPAIIEIRVWQ